ncbi:methyl-accepting chemotaxis protein [Muricoccus radiodurans]|uniref:methyl-accepting chemotaxis protein n=1 Tax=Muricoccus radiodurans TaxID=2231721 RepID=UPI003CEADD64
MSIVNRTLLGFSLLVLLMVGLGVYGLGQLESAVNTTQGIVARDVAMLRQVTSLREAQMALRDVRSGALIRYVERLTPGPEATRLPAMDVLAAWAESGGRTERLIAEIAATAQRYAATALVPDRIESWRQVAAALSQATGQLQQIRARGEAKFRAMAAGDTAAIFAAEQPLATATRELDATLDRAEDLLNGVITAGQRRVAEIYEDSRMSILVGLGVAVLLSILVSVLVRRAITVPLSDFTAFVQRVGRGDLTGAAAATGRDEIGQLGVTLNGMVEGLRRLAHQNREATVRLDAATAEIRASTQEQAASVEEQLAAVQETAATVDEITHSGAQIGKRAQEVIAAAQATVRTSDAGLHAVEETVRAMDGIREGAERAAENIVALSEKTQAIGEITATVNDISERAHLLALNAAIEAAAAGEAGRSFTVVAAELKSLADQAKEATAQVRAILGDVQRGINASVMLTEEAVKRSAAGRERTATTQESIREITARVQEAVQTFQQIVASTNQQQLGIEQVMGALTNIRQASQQTATGTRQLEQAAGNLAELSRELVTLAGQYRT